MAGDIRHMDPSLPRILPLQGASNVRDLGGWPTADGRRVRPGRIWRSAALHAVTDEDLSQLAGIGLRTVCDLRGVEEAARAPSRVPRGAMVHPLPIEPFVSASLPEALARSADAGAAARDLLRQAYLAYVTEHLDAYRRLFALLLEEDRHPLLFHCSAGKDRTGIGAALILTVLGADRATVLADYCATDRFWRRDHPLPPGTPEAAARAILDTHPALLEEALDLLLARHGGAEGLAREGLGVDPAALRAVLLAE